MRVGSSWREHEAEGTSFLWKTLKKDHSFGWFIEPCSLMGATYKMGGVSPCNNTKPRCEGPLFANCWSPHTSKMTARWLFRC